MSWNHRIIHRKCFDEDSFQIHEVFYDDAGEIDGWSKDPVIPGGDTVRDLRDELNLMLGACDSPVLEEHGDKLIDVI